MKNLLHFALLFLFVETALTQYFDGDYGNTDNDNTLVNENPSENDYNEQYLNDYPSNNFASEEGNGYYEAYPEYPSSDYVPNYPDYPNEDIETNNANYPGEYYPEDVYPEQFNYPKDPGGDYPQDPYQYPEHYPDEFYTEDAYPYSDYPGIEREGYPTTNNNRNPGKQGSNNVVSSHGQQKPLSRDSNKNPGKDKIEILEILKQILHAQKGGKKEKESSKKIDSSEGKLNIKDLLPYMKDIANRKEPDFGEIASKFGKNGLKEIQKIIDKGGLGEDNVGGNIAKAGLGILQNFL